jgi:hypothetical protein
MKNILSIAALAIIVTLSSCKKNLDLIVPAATPSATKISELKASPDFEWATVKNVSLNVTGLQTYIEVKRKLVVKDENGVEYFSVFTSMKNNLTTPIQLPSHLTKVVVEYGAIKKTVDITGNVIRFDFTPGITNEVL